ncbi:MAG: ethanolamine ammonia-lyase subunit EutC [Brevinemataceae bacterium]
MIKDTELKNIINKVIAESQNKSSSVSVAPFSNTNKPVEYKISQTSGKVNQRDNVSDSSDIGLKDLKEQILIDNPLHKEELIRLRRHTPARIAVGRAGTRYKTETILRFRADHATAQDAVFTDVSQEFLDKMHLQTVQTKCHDKSEYITRPDLGRQFDPEEIQKIKDIVQKDAQILIYVADGLSSTAVEDNVPDVLPMLIDGLKAKGLKVATPFFVKFGRVPTMDAIGDAVNVDVICLLVGERPGLVTASSMSAYFAYKPTIGMPESRRTVISNIHKGGTPPVEAAAHLVDILKKSLDMKASGLDLKL